MAGCGKLAALRHRPSDAARGGEWDLVVGGIVIRTAVLRWEVEAIRAAADRINAGVDAIVEARLDEITRRTN